MKCLIFIDSSTKEAAKIEASGGMSFLKKIAKKIDDVKQNPKISLSTFLEGQTQPSPKPVPGQANSDFKSTQESLNSVNTDSTSFGETTPTNVNTSNQQQQNNAVEQTIQNPNVQTTQSNPITQAEPENPDELFEFPETKRQLFATYYANNPFCIFIQGDSFRNSASEDKKQMLQKASMYIEDMLRALIKKRNVLAENKDLMSQLLQVFAKMLIHSKILLQEAKVFFC